MPYASAQQLVEYYGLTEISQLLSDEESLISEALLRDALAGNDLDADYDEDEQAAVARALSRIGKMLITQSSYMDSKIGIIFPLPLSFTEEQINGSPLLECCMALTRAALSDDDDNMTDDIKADRKHWRDWLDQIASGKAIIPGLVATKSKDSGGVVQQRIVRQSRSAINWKSY